MSGRANRWFLYGPFVIAAIVVVAWRVIWSAAADRMTDAVDEFAAAARAGGYEISFRPVKRSGFPFWLRGSIDAIVIGRADASYEVERLNLHLSPFDLSRIVLSPAGGQRIVTSDGAWSVSGDRMVASLERHPEAGWLAIADFGAVTATSRARKTAAASILVNVRPASNEPGRLGFSVAIAGAEVDLGGGATRIERLDAAGVADPRQDSRSVRLDGLELRIGASRLAAAGDLRPDGDGRVTGRLNTRLERPAELVSALSRLGVFNEQESEAANAAALLLSFTARETISAPITFADGRTKIAGVAIARAPRLGDPAAGQP